MVDLLSVLSIVLVIVIGTPTALLIIGRTIGLVASFGAKDVRTEKPTAAARGKALIVYEPGATRQTVKVGEEIGDLLLERGYEVTMAGIRSDAARDTTGYNLVLLGTPTYVGRPTGLIKKYVKNLHLTEGQIFGIYLIGTKGAPAVGLAPKAFLDAVKKPLEESGTTVKEMAFSGVKPFDFPGFVDTLLS